jgi:hypothetical protein
VWLSNRPYYRESHQWCLLMTQTPALAPVRVFTSTCSTFSKVLAVHFHRPSRGDTGDVQSPSHSLSVRGIKAIALCMAGPRVVLFGPRLTLRPVTLIMETLVAQCHCPDLLHWSHGAIWTWRGGGGPGHNPYLALLGLLSVRWWILTQIEYWIFISGFGR